MLQLQISFLSQNRVILFLRCVHIISSLDSDMTSPFWTTVCFFGHFVDENSGWSWKFSGGPKAVGLPINNETSCEELYAKVRNICKVDDIEIRFLSPAMVQSLQVPVRITSNDEVQWYFNLNKQGCYVPLCVTPVSQENCDVQREENNGFGCDMQREEENNGVSGCDMQPEGGDHNCDVEGNNASGGDDEVANDFSDRLEVIREPTSYNENNFSTTPRLEFSQGHRDRANREEKNFTSEHLVSSVGSSSRRVPANLDLKVDQVFDNKKELQEAVHMIALNYNFQFKTKKSNKNVYTIVCVDDNCKWRLRATKDSECDYFQIRKYTTEHTCALNLSTTDHRQATSRIIGKHISQRLEERNTTYRPVDVIHDVSRSFGVELSYQKARRCIKSALTHLRGTTKDIPDNIKEMTDLPPLVRPRARRRRAAKIPSTGEYSGRQKCSRCRQVGHNRLSCREQTPMTPQEK